LGSTDIDGKGTKHPITEAMCDPWVFCDEAVIPQGFRPPFGSHPHSGLVTNSVILTEAGMLWDNVTCATKEDSYGPVWSGGLFQLASNRGVIHDEGNPVPKEVADANPGKADVPHPTGMSRVMQVWFNPGMHRDEVMEAKAETNLVDPGDVPTYTDGESGMVGMSAKVLIGSYGGVSNTKAKTFGASVSLLNCKLPPSGFTKLAIPQGDSVWVYNSTDSPSMTLKCGEGDEHIPLPHQKVAVLSPGKCSITLTNTSDAKEACFFIGSGTPWGEDKVPVKLLGHDGALMGKGEDFVRAKMKEYEAGGGNFGR